MKLVRENINFERGKDPKAAMGLGTRELIEKWFNSWGFYVGGHNYTINGDFTIDVKPEFSLSLLGSPEIFPNGELPSYINFRMTGELDVDDCGLRSLRGFPQEVQGYFSCQLNELTSLEEGPKYVKETYYCNGNPGKFQEAYVHSVCNIGGVQADDTPDP